MAKGWRILQAMKKVTEPVGSTEMVVWHKSLTKDFTEEEYLNGIKACQDHLAFLTLAHFRNICRLTVSHKSHRVFHVEPTHNPLEPAEIRRRITEMRKRLDI